MKHYDVIVIGSGPAGQAAAIQCAKSKHTVAIVEKERQPGGSSLHHGTIPSKTLRENALQLKGLERHADTFRVQIDHHPQISEMMKNLDRVQAAHVRMMKEQMTRHGVALIHGRARFVSEKMIEVMAVDGAISRVRADAFLIATGSRPHHESAIPVDHENIFDSDSILSLIYLPQTLTVLGGFLFG